MSCVMIASCWATAVASEPIEPTLAATAASIGAATLALAATAPSIGRGEVEVGGEVDVHVEQVAGQRVADGLGRPARRAVRRRGCRSGCRLGRADGVVGLVDRAVLRGGGDGLAGDALVDQHALVGQRLGGRADRQHVGADGGVDRRGDVGVGGHGQVDRGGGVERDVEVGVEVQQRDDLLVRAARRRSRRRAPRARAVAVRRPGSRVPPRSGSGAAVPGGRSTQTRWSEQPPGRATPQPLSRAAGSPRRRRPAAHRPLASVPTMKRSAAAGARSSANRPSPLTAMTTTSALGRPGEQGDRRRGPLEDADPGAAAEDRRVLRAAGDADRGRVGRAQDGGRDRAAAQRPRRARPPTAATSATPSGASPAAQASAAGEGQQDGEDRGAPGRAEPLARGR